jgi:hypothetical protein
MSEEIKRLTFTPQGQRVFVHEGKSVPKSAQPKKSYLPVSDLHNQEPPDTLGATVKLKKLLPTIVSTWEEEQRSLFLSPLPTDWEDKIKDLYVHIWSQLPDELKNRLSQLSLSLFGKKEFHSLSLEKQNYLLNQLSKEKVTIGEKSFDVFLSDVIKEYKQENLRPIKRIALSLYCDQPISEILPSPVVRGIEESIKKHLILPIENLGQNGSIKFLGKGYVGMAFLVEIDGCKFVIKLPIAPKGKKLFQHFQYEQKNLRRYEEILKKHADKNPPEQDFIPRLIYDAEGQELSLEDKVLVTKFHTGTRLYSANKIQKLYKDGSKLAVNENYFRSGLDDDFLLDFIDFYLRFLAEGADLSDITVGNYFHKGVSLFFYELAGPDPEIMPRFDELKKLQTSSPIAACVFTLLTAISTLEQPKVSVGIANYLRQQYKETFGVEDFFHHRIAQLIKVFQRAIDKKILSQDELKNGINKLFETCSNPNVSANLRLSDKGLDYLSWLKEWVEG